MLKLWIVFPSDMQPTLAQVKIWNAHVHELRGVHWGTERSRTEVLAVEIESTSLQSYLQRSEAFDALVQAWLRRGAEIRDAFDFDPDRNALKPEKRGSQARNRKVRLFPSSARINEPEVREPPVAEELTSHGTNSHHQRRRQFFPGTSSPAGPWLLVGVFAAGTIALGFVLSMALRRPGMENRRITIERLDKSTRTDPRISAPTHTQFHAPTNNKRSSVESK